MVFDSIDSKPLHIQLLRAVRKRHHWTQAQLAAQLRVSKRTIIRWENDQQDPPVYLVQSLREMLE